MSQERIENGTIILDQKGAEIGVIKKIYSEKLARLELPNSDSIAFDPTLVADIMTSGRVLKKRSAVILPEANVFIKGATTLLKDTFYNGIEMLINHLTEKEIKKAIQHFEFDFLTKLDIEEKLPLQEALGFTRGIGLAIKTPQDFVIKMIFQASEDYPELKAKIPPEVVVDKLNQEKAFVRFLWNGLRIAISQATKLKEEEMIDAVLRILLEIGLKHIDIELKSGASSNDIQYLQNRIEECILKYYAVLILSLEHDRQEDFTKTIIPQLIIEIKSVKVNSSLRDQTIKMLESFELKRYEGYKKIELLHSGIKGFNLRVMSEKKAMKELLDITNEYFASEHKEGKSTGTLEKSIQEFAKNVRDVSKEFIDLLFEICQFLKKIEYGDSKVKEFEVELQEKIYKRKLAELGLLVNKINRAFIKN
ncbi:MAG: hypothetical protein ACTSP5_04775 [Candidatus Heimdallarchaeota archaeon]